MNRYQPSTPRVAVAVAAVAMTLITFGLAIIVPATIESGGEGIRTQAAYAHPQKAIAASLSLLTSGVFAKADCAAARVAHQIKKTDAEAYQGA